VAATLTFFVRRIESCPHGEESYALMYFVFQLLSLIKRGALTAPLFEPYSEQSGHLGVPCRFCRWRLAAKGKGPVHAQSI
jgi:hypothetical protein